MQSPIQKIVAAVFAIGFDLFVFKKDNPNVT